MLRVLGGWASVMHYNTDCWQKNGIPAHAASFVADGFPADAGANARISIVHEDGFGRPLQTKTKAMPGLAYMVENGKFVLKYGILEEDNTKTRWLVSGRVEYNNKGLPVRTYHPYFLDTHTYVADDAMRNVGYYAQHYYDPLGREIRVVRPDKYFRRQTYWPWYVIAEDENDTAGERNSPDFQLLHSEPED